MSLFDAIKKKVPEIVEQVQKVEFSPLNEKLSSDIPVQLRDIQKKEKDTKGTQQGISFADAISNLAAGSGEETAISGIMALTRADDGETPDCNLAMKSVVTNAGAFTAGQWMANYNNDLGMPMVADALRMLCKWHYTHNSALKGDRATKAFNALNEEKQKEFLLQKETQALMPK